MLALAHSVLATWPENVTWTGVLAIQSQFCKDYFLSFAIWLLILLWESVARTRSCTQVFYPKSTPAGDTIMRDLLGCWMGAATHTLLRERFLVNSTCVDLAVSPTCSLQFCLKEGQREMSLVFPSGHASTAGLKDGLELFEGECGSCFFCCLIFLLSLLKLGTVERLNHDTVFDHNEDAACLLCLFPFFAGEQDHVVSFVYLWCNAQ